MNIVDFTHAHICEAAELSLANYNEERSHVSALPSIDVVPDLTPFAGNEVGVAAFEGGKMVGFLCSYSPFDNAFRSTNVRGVFSPMGANAAIIENRGKIYAAMYQAAAAKWVRAGAVSHAVCLYAHDEVTQRQFYRYGFGLRTIDAVRMVDEVALTPNEDYSFYELMPADVLKVLPLDIKLDESYIYSPFFMYRKPDNEAEFLQKYQHFNSIYFVAEQKGQIVSFIRAELDGENFIQDTPGYLHVKGAFCLPKHRGKGINQQLLYLLLQKLKSKGYTRLGVDFESFNPSGSSFWLKHFTAYTHGVVRRIDEQVLEMGRRT